LQKWSTFVDISDYYTQFLFNLLKVSLQLRSYSLSLTTYQDASDWPDFILTLSKLIRICLDFSSSNSGSLEGKDANTSAHAHLLK
jgi:hypothetical protein